MSQWTAAPSALATIHILLHPLVLLWSNRTTWRMILESLEKLKFLEYQRVFKFIKCTSKFRFATDICSVPNNTGAAVVCLFAVQTNRFGIIICLERTHTVSHHQPVSGSVCYCVLKGRRQSLNSLLSIFPNPCWKRLFCINVNFTKLLPAGCDSTGMYKPSLTLWRKSRL